jgi:hypothetical protein
MPNQTPLASGSITNHDEITVIVIEATTEHRSTYECIRRYAPQRPPPTTTLLWRRRSYASSPSPLQLWRDTRQETDYEK